MRSPNLFSLAILILTLAPLWAASPSDASFAEPETPSLILVMSFDLDQDQPSLTLTLMTCASDESPWIILFTLTVAADFVDISFPLETFLADDETEFLDGYQAFSVEDEPVSETPDGGP